MTLNRIFLLLAVMGLSAAIAPAALILDDFTTAAGGTGNSVQNNNPADGCNGPSTGNHNGTNIMGGSGTRFLSMNRTSGPGTRCLQGVVDQATTFNDLQMNSDPNTSGILTITGSGSNYGWLANDAAVTFLASHDLQTLVTSTVQVFLHVSGGGFIGAAPVTVTSSGLTLHTINVANFNIGGAISTGTVLDGYQIVVNGGLGSDLVIDELKIATGNVEAVPEPSTVVLFGLGTLGLVLRRRR